MIRRVRGRKIPRKSVVAQAQGVHVVFAMPLDDAGYHKQHILINQNRCVLQTQWFAKSLLRRERDRLHRGSELTSDKKFVQVPQKSIQHNKFCFLIWQLTLHEVEEILLREDFLCHNQLPQGFHKEFHFVVI